MPRPLRATDDRAADLVVALVISSAWPDTGGEHPDPSRCSLCRTLHEVGAVSVRKPCTCACHPARDYLREIGRYDEVHDHWQPETEDRWSD